jgi:hypothetical protein
MKYIMFKRQFGSLTKYVPVIFPKEEIHSNIAEALLAGPLKGAVVHSAGEIDLALGVATGRSQTLGVQFDPTDGDRIAMCDYGGCFE